MAVSSHADGRFDPMTAARRWWRMAPWNTNPLMRPSDRLRSALAIFAVAVCIASVPFAVAAGTASYTDAADRTRAEDAAETPVTATLVMDPVYDRSARGIYAQASWRRAGSLTTTFIGVPVGAVRGDRIRVWLDSDGAPVAPPPWANAAPWIGIGVSVGIVFGICCAAALSVEFVRRRIARANSSQWDRRWRSFDRDAE